MGLRLRDYQVRSLSTLATYLQEAAEHGAKRGFIELTERPYRSVPQLPELPYVCLRVPTGGGKTIMAAHAVGIAAERFVRRDHVTCLWLVPSNAILEQTLRHLRTRGDPYRDALAERFGGRVTVLDLAESLYVQRGTLDGETVVIVSTLAALRVTDTEGRKVYEQNGALEHHFTGLPPELLEGLDRRIDGRPIESLANVLRLRRPVLIMDEAHNARTTLTFDTLERLSPSCIVEFTATPETRHAPESGHFASNVLAHVSAAELKAEEMIKLPVRLWTKPVWTEAVTDALARQRELEQVASKEQQASGERIRPIVLFQAEPRRQAGGSISVEVLKRSLIEDHHVTEEQIAVATGSTRELDGVDLMDPACPIRFVITVQALREGWDCPWAYVLCSVAEQASPRAVEQIIGRVMRLPQAKRKANEALNLSYAYVVSQTFASAAQSLRDALIENGFERYEINQLIEVGTTGLPLFHAIPEAPVRRVVSERPNLGALPPGVLRAVSFDEQTRTLSLSSPLTEGDLAQLLGCFTTAAAKAEVRALADDVKGGTSALGGPRERTAALVVPQLAVRRRERLELFEESHFLNAPWRLADCDPSLSESDFPLVVRAGAAGELDVSAEGKLQVSFHEEVANQLALLEGEPGWTVMSLAVWLDAHIPHPDLTQGDASVFINNGLESLIARNGVTIQQLARDKYRLRKALESKINVLRATQRGKAFQAALFEGKAGRPEVDPEIATVFENRDRYAPNWIYEGGYRFQRHFFPQIGELASQGEEYDCAVRLDEHPSVECWVRNLDRRPADSFWLPTSTDRFYPDFVGRLRGGRVFALEYKGEHLWTADDAKEKRAVGDLWAASSRGRCVFVMPKGPDWGGIDAVFRMAA